MVNEKLKANFIAVAPGSEAAAILIQELTSKSVILVGERTCESAGALSAVVVLADRTGAKVAWIPRRAGERGALEAGAIANLLPGGRPVSDIAARLDISTAWDVASLPTEVGLTSESIFAAADVGEIEALVVAGVDPLDAENSHRALVALKKDFVVSLEILPSSVTQLADVVLPVAPITAKSV